MSMGKNFLEDLAVVYESLHDRIAKYEERGDISFFSKFFLKQELKMAEYCLQNMIFNNLGISIEDRIFLRNKEPWRIEGYIEKEFRENPVKYTAHSAYLPNLRKNVVKKFLEHKLLQSSPLYRIK